jgi:hypothetical protein
VGTGPAGRLPGPDAGGARETGLTVRAMQERGCRRNAPPHAARAVVRAHGLSTAHACRPGGSRSSADPRREAPRHPPLSRGHRFDGEVGRLWRWRRTLPRSPGGAADRWFHRAGLRHRGLHERRRETHERRPCIAPRASTTSVISSATARDAAENKNCDPTRRRRANRTDQHHVCTRHGEGRRTERGGGPSQGVGHRLRGEHHAPHERATDIRTGHDA